MTMRWSSGMMHYLMKRLAFLQHLDIGLDASLSRLGLLRRLDPPQDRVGIGSTQRFEERFCLWVLVQFCLQIVGHRRRAERAVGSVPSAILFCPLDLGESGGLHAPRGDQGQGLFAIDLRPDAARPARHEALQPCRFALGALLPVYPAVAERDLYGLRVGDRLYARRFPGDPHPDPIVVCLIFRDPRVPGLRVLEGLDWSGISGAGRALRRLWRHQCIPARWSIR